MKRGAAAAAEIVLRAERRIGELTREAPKAKGSDISGRRRKLDGARETPSNAAPTLADVGLTKKQSMQWLAIAAIPEPVFEAHVKTAQNYAAEIVLRAERRMGELLREAPKAKGAPGPGRGKASDKPSPAFTETPTLADQGVSRKQSSRWQALAAIPEKQFEENIATTKAKGEKLTTSGAIAVAEPKPPSGDEDAAMSPRNALPHEPG